MDLGSSVASSRVEAPPTYFVDLGVTDRTGVGKEAGTVGAAEALSASFAVRASDGGSDRGWYADGVVLDPIGKLRWRVARVR